MGLRGDPGDADDGRSIAIASDRHSPEREGVFSVLRISLPYHDRRMPPELTRADYAVSANIGRTIDATRQAVG